MILRSLPCLLFVSLLVAAQLTTDGHPTEYDLPHPNSGPTTIAIAPDGSIWFTEGAGNRIGKIEPDGTGLKEFDLPHPGSQPRIIALGADKNMWFSEHLGNRIGRITPAGNVAEFDIPTPASQPRAIALSSDGNIWFGEFKGGKIGRVTPSGVVTEFPIPTPDSGPRALSAGPDGNVWFSEFNTAKIGRITPDGKITEFKLSRPDIGPGDITAGVDGNLWFLELDGRMDDRMVDGNRVARITPSGVVTEFVIPTPHSGPINIAVGPDKNIWFTGRDKLGRVTMDGAIIEFPLAPNTRPTGLSAGSDRQPPELLTNKLWYAAAGSNKIGFLLFH
jgi:virginiamycin B lyase